MKLRHLLLLPLLATTTVASMETLPVLKVHQRALLTPCGEKLVLKGVNKMFIWRDLEGATVDEIEKTGANAIRLVWLREGSLEDFESIIRKIVSHGMVAIPELHDGTVAPRDDAGWGMLDELVDWWVSDPVVEILKRYESHIVLNIANELGKTVPVEDFITDYSRALQRIRATGLRCPILIDCNEYGKEITMIRKAGPSLMKADPGKNVFFSVHTWWHIPWGWTQERAETEMRLTIETGIPFIIGEFSMAGIEGNPLVDHIPLLRMALENDVGYLVWSWGPGNSDNPEMDMTGDGTYDTLHGYGKAIVDDPVLGFKSAFRQPPWGD